QSGQVQQYALPLIASEGFSPQGPSGAISVDVQQELEPPLAVTLSDALQNPGFAMFLVDLIQHERRIPGVAGELRAGRAGVLDRVEKHGDGSLEPSLVDVEQSNSSIRYGNRLILKFFRRIEHGVNLDLEMGRFLTETAAFEHVPPAAGFIEYGITGGTSATLALLQGFVHNQGDAWRYALQILDNYLARATAAGPPPARLLAPSTLGLAEVPGLAAALLGEAIPFAELLGVRTAQLHQALASEQANRAGPDFAPEPFSAHYRETLSQSAVSLAREVLRILRNFPPPAAVREAVQSLLASEEAIIARFEALRGLPLTAMRTRVHGDYHLGQVLYTGSDFVIIDFEGEPERPLAERRQKRSPLSDVAGMLRSFDYASYSALREKPAETGNPLESWAALWASWVRAVFLRSYLRTAGDACFIPQDGRELGALLDFHLLEKAVYELGYELKNRPEWVSIPIAGVLDVLGHR
ncbi:MAG: putative maltokinase, partial [Terriglobia bacterium]